MPRPQPPQRVRHVLNLDNDAALAELADLLPDDQSYRILKTTVDRLVDDFVASWRPRKGPGRRDESERDALLDALARVFHEQSGWRLRYQQDSPDYLKEYRSRLIAFLVFILVANLIPFPGHRLVSLRMVSPRWRKPRP